MAPVTVWRALTAPLAAAVLAGCSLHLGGSKRALRPEGETVTVAPAPGRPLTGEFLGVRENNLVLLCGGRLVEVPLARLTRVEVKGYPAVRTDQRGLLLPYARYPQGLDAAQWTEVLRTRGQIAFDPAPGP
jgi:hypothetical protein